MNMKDNTRYKIVNDCFMIENYNHSPVFASFLPGIAGAWGKPMWVYYTNRNQLITSLGIKDKDGAIVEFLPANKAYKEIATTGFRTFIKIEKKIYEPFLPDNEALQILKITSSDVGIEEINRKLNLKISVEYFTLPEENIPAFVRVLKIKNTGKIKRTIEVIDGLPWIVPYGITNSLLKNVSNLAKGWFSGVFFEKDIPVFKLQIKPEDRPEVFKIQGGNFYYGYIYTGEKKYKAKIIVDRTEIFGERTDLLYPENFEEKFKIKRLLSWNEMPCAMGYFKIQLPPSREITYFSVSGFFLHKKILADFIKKFKSPEFIYQKQKRNKQIIDEITDRMFTLSADDKFNNYCKQSFLDNILRGGFPVAVGENKKSIIHIFSRIHGDMEREYNDFEILPEYFSQGNGNYRDVNQNRRDELFFLPDLKEENLRYFLNLIQLDGYNPLKIKETRFWIKKQKEFLKIFSGKVKKLVKDFINSPITPGEFFNYLEQNEVYLSIKDKERILNKIVEYSEKVDNALPYEGYWTDHWHYNIDLLQNFEAIYPDKIKELFLSNREFMFYDNPMVVRGIKEKYVIFNNRPSQIGSVYWDKEKEKMINKRKVYKYFVRTKYGRGEVYKTYLMVKLFAIVCNKFASIDPYGTGIEMEADKPNWCDALNGLPAMFGSSSNELFELKRLIDYLLYIIKEYNLPYDYKFPFPEEIYDFVVNLVRIIKRFLKTGDSFELWKKSHAIRDKYRETTRYGISGKEKLLSIKEIYNILSIFKECIDKKVNKVPSRNGLVYSYFINEVVKYKKKEVKNRVYVEPLKFQQKPLPLFLEGIVHNMKIVTKEKAEKIHRKVLKSELIDKKTGMLKINAPLKNVPVEIGRIKVFTPGWLENESIWLHMEYKYLLELLRKGLADQFWKLFKKAGVLYLDPQVYGRSIFENVSFIVSSAHPDKRLHGRGFVARLTGANAEMVSIWIGITTGYRPFYLKEGKLYLKFRPSIPGELFTENKRIYNGEVIPPGSFLFKFLGRIPVIYHNPGRKDTYGKNGVKPYLIHVYYRDGRERVYKEEIPYPCSEEVRSMKVSKIYIELK